jgi:ribose transport system ATP-binding protein
VTAHDPVLRVRGVEKSFAGVRALSDVDLDVGPGEIHALLGENGAGKSTLIKVLAGVHRPDAGSIDVNGTRLPAGFGPRDVAAAGLRFVHQDLGLVDGMTVFENMAFQTGFSKRFGLIDDAATAATVGEQLARLGSTADPRALVGDLPQAEKAIVALARAMQGDARLIVLDEVTASLPSPDAARVHAAVRAASRRGVAFVYVSHRLEEIFALCERVTVFADGRNVAAARICDVDMDMLVRWIAGKSVARGRQGAARPAVTSAVRLSAVGLAGPGVDGVLSIDVRAGEIVGVTGSRGSGYERLCRWLAGIEKPARGEIRIDGSSVETGSPRRMRDAGCEVILGDRSEAAFPDLSVRENVFPSTLGGGGARGPRHEQTVAAAVLARFNVRPAGACETAMMGLSGGNQQKVIFARAMGGVPKVIVLIDPTAGVDIGARGELHALLRSAAQAGAAVVLGSSDFEEIAGTVDRALVMRADSEAVMLNGEELGWDRLFKEAHGAAHIPAGGERPAMHGDMR